ncbi:MAG TPA: ammonium transporter [Chthoniobacteraceae bacterium]|nr:ammonium transporter [Chthoniobacteraceae bacterium]
MFSLALSVSLPAAVPERAAATPTLEQRVAGLEAYLNNTNPAAALEDADGVLQEGLKTPSVGVPGPGHNAWMMVSAALVLMMTLPGLALFYGGLVRRKNVLSVMAQCLGIASMVTLLWWAVGYSLVFSPGGNSIIGGLDYVFLKGVGPAPNPDISPWISHNIFAMFQMMFAIIAPALIVGAIAERMRFGAILAFVALWMFLVYFPLAHMVWGDGGLMNGIANGNALIRTIDFAGGTVVHMSSGWSALVLCMILGRRLGHGRENFAPHNLVLCMVGTGMLWVGWYGFNAGSALAADGVAANAFMTTTLATAAACGCWGILEFLHRGKASVLGFCSGVVGGLVIITPAAGFVNATGAVLMGLLGTPVCYLAVVKLKGWIGYDDALDTFGVHAVGGTVGAFLTGIFARIDVNGNLAAHLEGVVGRTLWIEQLKAIVFTIVLVVAATAVITLVLKALMNLRPTPEGETTGLDLVEHGEEGYNI